MLSWFSVLLMFCSFVILCVSWRLFVMSCFVLVFWVVWVVWMLVCSLVWWYCSSLCSIVRWVWV